MKKRMSLLLITFLSVALLAACGEVPSQGRDNSSDTSGKIDTETKQDTASSDDTEEQYELPEDKIIYIRDYVNFAEGFVKTGYFINSSGEMYIYDFSGAMNAIWNDDKDMLPILERIEELTDPVLTIEPDVLQTMYNKMMAIENFGPYTTENVAMDAGSVAYYAVIDDELKKMGEYGDFEGCISSEKYEEFNEYFKENIATLYNDYATNHEYGEGVVYYYDANYTRIYNCHDGYFGDDYWYILDDVEDFETLNEKCGIDLISFDMGVEKPEYIFSMGNYVLVEHVDVPSGGYNLKIDGVYAVNGQIYLAYSPDSVSPGPDDTVETVMDGFTFVAVLPTVSLGMDYDSKLGEYHVEGWEIIE